MTIPANEYSTLHALQTYGAWADIEQIDSTLEIGNLVKDVPTNSHVLNIGAGVHLGINSLARHIRPDIHITSLDPGYSINASMVEGLCDTDSLVAGIAENLPFSDRSFDFIFGHASVPENMHQHPDNYHALLGELSRVAKNGAMIVLNPHMIDFEEQWRQALDSQVDRGSFSKAAVHETIVAIPSHGIELPAQVTTLQR